MQVSSGAYKSRRESSHQCKTVDDRFNDLMAFKAKYGHCDVYLTAVGCEELCEDSSLGSWCSGVRRSYKKMRNNQKPTTKLSDEQIQRLSDVGFKWLDFYK